MMRNLMKRKTGAPPGTVIYSGKETTKPVIIELIEYDEHTFLEKQFTEIEECLTYVKPAMVKWINIHGIHKEEIIETIGKLFNIHPLTLEDIVNIHQRPKFEDYDEYNVSIMQMLYYQSELKSEQLSIILLKDTVISFQEVEGADAFDLIRQRIRQGKGRIRKCGPDYLAYALIDAVVDCYFNILEKVGDRIELLEEELMEKPEGSVLSQLHIMKREMIFLRKAIWPLRELINNMQRSESNLISKSTDIYLRDVHDHTIRLIDSVETYRDLLSGMMDIYLSSINNRMNEVMKMLTIISTIFIPVTFVSGVYGMNFDHMPGLHSTWGYISMWLIMISIMLSLVYYFRRKKWL